MWTLLTGFFGSFKYQIIGLILATIIFGGAYFYWNYSQEKIAELNQKLAQNETIIKTQYETIGQLSNRIVTIQKTQDELNKQFVQIQSEVSNLVVLFSEHNLEELAAKRPTLIQKKINAAVKRLMKEIEAITQIDYRRKKTENETVE